MLSELEKRHEGAKTLLGIADTGEHDVITPSDTATAGMSSQELQSMFETDSNNLNERQKLYFDAYIETVTGMAPVVRAELSSI